MLVRIVMTSIIFSFTVAGCGGGGGGSSTSASQPSTPSTSQPTSNAFFNAQADALPSFTTYYAGFSGYGGGLFFSNAIATTIDAKPTLIFFFHKTQATGGTAVTSKVENAEIILQRQADGTFTDETRRLLGTSPFSLNGQAGGTLAVKTNLSNSTNPTILIAGNAEDGRLINSPGSVDTVVSQIQIPQTDGTYTTLNLGKAVFGGKGSMNVLGDNFFVGDFKRVEDNYRSTPSGAIGTYYQPYYQYNRQTSAFVEAGIAPTHAYGFEFVNADTMFTTVTNFATSTSGPTGYAFALAGIQSNTWSLGEFVVPFPNANHTYINSAGQSVSLKDVGQYGYVIDGVNVYGVLLSVQGKADIDGDGVVEFITGINAGYVPSLRSDGKAYEADFKGYLKLQFWNVVNGKIITAKIKLQGETTAVNQSSFQLVDVNNDGRLDVVVNSWNATGAPEVYLNQGDSVLSRVDPTKFPTVSIGTCCSPATKYSSAIFFDVNGDKLLDLIYQPYAVKSVNSGDSPVVYLAAKALTN